jgi:putative membrane protein
MNHVLQYLTTFPDFIKYLGVAITLFIAYLAVYLWMTPHSEIKLIKQGNESAAIALAGSLLGFVFPLASAIAHSVSIADLAVWGIVALIIQTLAFAAIYVVVGKFSAKIESNQKSAAIFASAVFISVGIINAACMIP